MTIRYVGKGGSDANNGLSWATRKLTLNGAEDTPVQAGDTVYVGAGTYRELLTCDVSGSSGLPITYIGDYDGSHTDGVGGVVRITGSNDDKTATRANCINGNAKNFRTFKGFTLDTTTNNLFAANNCNNLIVQNMHFGQGNAGSQFDMTSIPDDLVLLIDGCCFGTTTQMSIYFSKQTIAANAVISNCIFRNFNSNFGVRPDGIGDLLITNCLFESNNGIRVITINPPEGHPTVVNNCIFHSGSIISNALGNIVEDYNVLSTRTNVAVGAHSVAYPMLPDTRWFFEMVNGGKILTPFDLAEYSQVIDLAGLNPTATDMRGTGKIGDEREWGALEYDPDLKIKAGGDTPPSAKPKTGGQVRRMN